MNATVSLPISELDALRDDVKESKAKLTELEATQKQIKIIVAKKDDWARPYYSAGWKTPPLSEREVVISTTFVNLNEIQDEFLELAKSQVSGQLQNYRATIKANEDSYKAAREKREEEIKELLLTKDKQIAKLMKEEVDKTKDEEIASLNKRIIKLGKDWEDALSKLQKNNERNWYQRLFNI